MPTHTQVEGDFELRDLCPSVRHEDIYGGDSFKSFVWRHCAIRSHDNGRQLFIQAEPLSRDHVWPFHANVHRLTADSGFTLDQPTWAQEQLSIARSGLVTQNMKYKCFIILELIIHFEIPRLFSGILNQGMKSIVLTLFVPPELLISFC